MFSTLKRMFGEAVRSRNKSNMVTELLLKMGVVQPVRCRCCRVRGPAADRAGSVGVCLSGELFDKAPYLNPVEACWKEGRWVLLVSEYYETFAAMCTAVSEYYRTVRFRLDLSAYLYRSPAKFLMNL